MVLHIVEPGQTLYSIARQYGVSPERLRTNNGIGPTAQLAVGQCIAVLFPLVTHVVRAGERSIPSPTPTARRCCSFCATTFFSTDAICCCPEWCW